MAVNTAKVEGRRKLDFGSYQEMLADADRLGSGPVKVLGNWSPGKIFKHLAIVYNGSIDGLNSKAPWPIRVLGRLMKNKLLSGPMPAGLKLPTGAAKLLIPDETSIDEGLAALHAAVVRLEQEPHRAEHPVFGAVTREEWDRIHLKHASLHLSFLIPQA